MTHPTIADLRALLEAEASDVQPLSDPFGLAPQRDRKTARTRITATATVVVTVLALVGLAVALDRAGDGGHQRTASRQATWRTFASSHANFTVRYPSRWQAATYEEVSSFSDAIVFFSNQAMASPCRTSTSGDITNVDCGATVKHLNAGGLSVNWSNEAFLAPHTLATTPGVAMTIGGEPAKIAIGHAPECVRINGRISITVTVQRPNADGNYYVGYACINASQHSQQVTQVLASLRSMRQR